MSDLLVRLYALPDPASWYDRVAAAGIVVRRCEAWDRFPLRRFVAKQFGDNWASETDFAMSGGHPITGFVAVKDGEIIGFAVYESSRRGFFGPTGVREDLRGNGAGAALLFRCLEDMREVGYAYAIIGDAGPEEYYAKLCGATPIDGSAPGIYASLYDERAAREHE